MKRYLFFWISLTVALLLFVATINVVTDPYGLYRIIDAEGFNKIKPAASNQGAMAKAYQAIRMQPRALILGNSRAEMGFDPAHPAWPDATRPVLNLALPGTGTGTTEEYLQHVIINAEMNSTPMPEMLIWGIDLIDFLVDENSSHKPHKNAFQDSRLFGYADNKSKYRKWLIRSKDYLQSTFTLAALLDSIETLTSQKNPYATNLTSQGFNPMQNYKKLAAVEGYANLFKAKDQTNIDLYQRLPNSIFDSSGTSSARLKNLENVLNLSRQHGISVNLVIYPYHARLLETIRLTGHWQDFENWKRTLVQIVENASISSPPFSVKLWDFSGFDRYSTESIPPQGDRKTVTQWYWEAGHFKSELGDKILDRILGSSQANGSWGFLLTSATVDAHIAAIQIQEEAYRKSHSDEVNELESYASKKPMTRPIQPRVPL